MRISLISTIKNEELTVKNLIDSILSQTKHVDEVIIVDGGSSDSTIEILNKSKMKNLKIFVEKGMNISQGRNLAIRRASGEIIVSVDGGCSLDKNYIELLTKPFEDKNIMFTGAMSIPKTNNTFEKCVAVFLTKDKLPDNYLPKGHAMAFRKSLWEKIGGFPENLKAAEDTYFGKKVVELGYKPLIVKNAIIYWNTRKTLSEVSKQFKNYGFYDAKAFDWKSIPSNSKKTLLISIIFPLAILHSLYMGLKISLKLKNPLTFIYGFIIDIIKLYSYSYGLIKGKVIQ